MVAVIKPTATDKLVNMATLCQAGLTMQGAVNKTKPRHLRSLST